MARVLYIPSYSAEAALTKLRIIGKEIPFYWHEPEAAHDMASRHYPGGKVYAVSIGADGRLMAREHALGDPAPEATDISILDGAGSLAAALLLVIGGCWAIAHASLI